MKDFKINNDIFGSKVINYTGFDGKPVNAPIDLNESDEKTRNKAIIRESLAEFMKLLKQRENVFGRVNNELKNPLTKLEAIDRLRRNIALLSIYTHDQYKGFVYIVIDFILPDLKLIAPSITSRYHSNYYKSFDNIQKFFAQEAKNFNLLNF